MATWEQQKINAIEIATREIPEIEVELFEWPQLTEGGTSRKRSSLWSHRLEEKPTSVEEATANHFCRNGWTISETPFFLLNAFGIAEALASLGPKAESNFQRLLKNKLFYDEVCRILRSMKPSTAAEFEHWLERILSNKESISELCRLKILPAIHSRRGNHENLNSGSKDEELKAIMELHATSPRQTWQTAYLINRERLRRHGSFSGIPDLLAWHQKSFMFVEVKSPNDSIQLSQALFYSSVTKPLAIPCYFAKIISTRTWRKI